MFLDNTELMIALIVIHSLKLGGVCCLSAAQYRREIFSLLFVRHDPFVNRSVTPSLSVLPRPGV